MLLILVPLLSALELIPVAFLAVAALGELLSVGTHPDPVVSANPASQFLGQPEHLLPVCSLPSVLPRTPRRVEARPLARLMLHPKRFSEWFEHRTRQLGLPKIRLHDLRHGWATMALAAGVHPEGRPGAPWPRQHQHHAGHVRPHTATSQLASTTTQPSGSRACFSRLLRWQSVSRPAPLVPSVGLACGSSGAPGGTRTHTERLLRVRPLPIGIRGRAAQS
jgi:hypothetical protein